MAQIEPYRLVNDEVFALGYTATIGVEFIPMDITYRKYVMLSSKALRFYKLGSFIFSNDIPTPTELAQEYLQRVCDHIINLEGDQTMEEIYEF